MVVEMGGEIHLRTRVDQIHAKERRVTAVSAVNEAGERLFIKGDYFISTMPMRDLVSALDVPVPPSVKEVSDGLQYRDFITVGLLAKKLSVTEPGGGLIEGHLDLYSGAGCAPWPAADLQQLEPVYGCRSGYGVARPGVLLPRDRRSLEDAG